MRVPRLLPSLVEVGVDAFQLRDATLCPRELANLTQRVMAASGVVVILSGPRTDVFATNGVLLASHLSSRCSRAGGYEMGRVRITMVGVLVAVCAAGLIGCGSAPAASPHVATPTSVGALPSKAAASRPSDATATPAAELRPPRIEAAAILVLSGVDRAYVRYTVIGHGANQYASQDQITAVRDDGKTIKWRHQTATGGPSDIVASEGRIQIGPGSRWGGDGDYFNVSDLGSTRTVTVTFYFPSGPLVVPFKVERAGQS